MLSNLKFYSDQMLHDLYFLCFGRVLLQCRRAVFPRSMTWTLWSWSCWVWIARRPGLLPPAKKCFFCFLMGRHSSFWLSLRGARVTCRWCRALLLSLNFLLEMAWWAGPVAMRISALHNWISTYKSLELPELLTSLLQRGWCSWTEISKILQCVLFWILLALIFPGTATIYLWLEAGYLVHPQCPSGQLLLLAGMRVYIV